MTRAVWGETAIVGIGQTEFSHFSGRSELQLAVEAITAALDDAEIPPNEIDGLVTYDVDNNDPQSVANALGLGAVTFFSRSIYGGGGATATIQQAALAIASGSADVVVVYRAMNERSAYRFGQPRDAVSAVPWLAAYTSYGLITPAQWAALAVHRYMHDHGVTNADFAPISVQSRKYAATNPNAYFYERPITAEDHDTSPWVVEPVLRLLDCCLESDGGVAVVMTSVERARDLPNPPAVILGGSQALVGGDHVMMNYYRDDVGTLPSTRAAAQKLYQLSGLGPDDIDIAILYDHFTPWVMLQLEEFGFCARGESREFIASGALGPGGALPVNTNGGQLGEGYVHGMNGLAEAVRQIRGTAVNQVEDAELALVTSGVGLPTGAIILGPS